MFLYLEFSKARAPLAVSMSAWLWSVANNIWLNKDGKWESDAECDDDHRVTHWKPLPLPPASDSMAQKGGRMNYALAICLD